ncbi:uncharacterized protein [Petaurus breviceps papuanus]|uniref:uncharacterized protein n=1 Tax=Petaurus breviceps papuanus TaxID=3040969 RepID=UPI0036DEAC69
MLFDSRLPPRRRLRPGAGRRPRILAALRPSPPCPAPSSLPQGPRAVQPCRVRGIRRQRQRFVLCPCSRRDSAALCLPPPPPFIKRAMSAPPIRPGGVPGRSKALGFHGQGRCCSTLGKGEGHVVIPSSGSTVHRGHVPWRCPPLRGMGMFPCFNCGRSVILPCCPPPPSYKDRPLRSPPHYPPPPDRHGTVISLLLHPSLSGPGRGLSPSLRLSRLGGGGDCPWGSRDGWEWKRGPRARIGEVVELITCSGLSRRSAHFVRKL